MQLPLQITYRHMHPSGAIETMIREKLAKLDRFFNGVVGCRIVVEAPAKPNRQYQVHIDLKVPGGELVVNREPGEVGSHKDLTAAVNDAFDAMRRQLEDYARRLRGEVKVHA